MQQIVVMKCKWETGQLNLNNLTNLLVKLSKIIMICVDTLLVWIKPNILSASKSLQMKKTMKDLGIYQVWMCRKFVKKMINQQHALLSIGQKIKTKITISIEANK